MNASIYVLTSISDMTPTSNPSYLNIVLVVQFLQRLSLLFPQDSYELKLDETYLSLLRMGLSPFTLTGIIQGTDFVCYLIYYFLLCSVVVMFVAFGSLVVCCKFKFYNPTQPKGIYLSLQSMIYYALMNADYWICLPFFKIMISTMVCGEQSIFTTCRSIGYIIISILLIISMVVILMLSNFYFRSYQLQPNNVFKRKFNVYQLLIPLLSLVLIITQYLEVNSFIIFIRLLLGNIIGCSIVIESYVYCPLTPHYNQLAFNLGCIYECFTLLFTVSIISSLEIINLHTLPFLSLVVCTLIYYCSVKVYEDRLWWIMNKQHIKSPYLQLYQVQLYMYLYETISNQKNKIMWYYGVINHLSLCNTKACKDLYERITNHGVENYKSTTRTVVHGLIGSNLLKSSQSEIEFPQLVMIWFYSIQCQQPLPAYLLLKQYMQLSDQHSFYFKSIKYSIEYLLRSQVITKQQAKTTHVSDEHLDKEITIQDVYQSLQFNDNIIPKIVEVIDLKVKYWEKIINGYLHITEFAAFTIRVSRAITELRNYLHQLFLVNLDEALQVKQFGKVSQLKLLSLFYAAVANDMQNCVHCEVEIEEILLYERSFALNLVSNTTLINSKVVLLSITTIRNRGAIVQKSNSHEFFGYDEAGFKRIDNIEQLMPQFIRKRHPQILDRFLKIGVSERFLIPKIVFLLSQDGFLSAAHIKINNFFDQPDDYVLSASFNRVKENSDYILFDAQGKIIGLTKSIFLRVQEVCANLSLSFLTKQGFIFLLFPEILNVISSQREDMLWNDLEMIQIDQKTQMNIPPDFMELCKSFLAQGRYQKSASKSVRSDKEFERVQSEATNEFCKTNSNFDENQSDDTHINGCYIPLLDVDYIDMINNFILNRTNVTNAFYVNYMLKFKILGYGKDSYPYFYLELSEFKKQEYGTTRSGYLTVTQTNNKGEGSGQSSIVEVATSISAIQGTFDQNANINDEDEEKVKILSSALKMEDKQMKWSYYIEDSARVPLSKRAIFENPLSLDRRLDNEMNLLDKDFKDIIEVSNLNQLNQSDQISQKNNESQQQLNSSSQKQQQSHQIKQIMKQHDKNNVGEIDLLQSQHSFVTTTSNTRDTTFLIRSIKHSTNMNGVLRIIILLLMMQLLIILVHLITKVLLLTSHENEQVTDMDDIYEPYQFQVLYERAQAYGWMSFIQHYNIANYSEYIKGSVVRQSKVILTELENNVQQGYPTFVKVESQGLLTTFDVNYITIDTWKDAYFSIFYFQIYEKLSSILENIVRDNIVQDQIVDLIFLNQNMHIQYELILDLMTDLIYLFNESKSQQQSYNVLVFLIFIVLIAFFNFIQIIFWNQILQFQQKVLINSSRLSEKQALLQIMRLQVVKEITAKKSTIDWKKVDYFRVMYHQWNEINLQQMNLDDKLFKKSIQSELDQDQSDNRDKKRRAHQILNSKIQNTQFMCIVEVFILSISFLIVLGALLGGYQLEIATTDLMKPTQQLMQGFLKYSLDFDRQIQCAFIGKVENLIVPFIEDNKLISLKHTDISISIEVIQVIYDHYEDTSNDMTDIYNDLNANQDLTPESRALLLELYNQNFCNTELNNYIEFCQFSDSEQFIAEYGQFYPQDDNSQFIRSGILGQQSKTKKIITENFGYETSHMAFQPDQDYIRKFIESADFINGVIQHFTNYQRAYNIFINTLIQEGVSLIHKHTTNMLLYYYCMDFGIILLVGGIQLSYIKYRNWKLHMIRMGILNMPMDILQDPQMKQFLKIVERN